jgi:hypothetical protein
MSTVEIQVDGQFCLTLTFTQMSTERLEQAISIHMLPLPVIIPEMHSYMLQMLHTILTDATASMRNRSGKTKFDLRPRLYTRNSAMEHDVID